MNDVLKSGQEKTEKEEGRQKGKKGREKEGKGKGKGIKIENLHCSLTLLSTYRSQHDFPTRDLRIKSVGYIL
jgi:hypothetical protein